MADVKFDETWPFRIRIMDGDRTVAVFERILSSTTWKTLDDVREARKWDGMTGAPTAEDARELIARQEREVTMFAASPDLYEACRDYLHATDELARFEGENPHDSGKAWEVRLDAKNDARNRMRAALTKAEGQS